MVSVLVHRYARAFFATIHDTLNQETIAILKQATQHLQQHQASMQLLHFLADSVTIKQAALSKVLAQLGIDPVLLQPLSNRLFLDKRIYLLPAIIEQLPRLYYAYHHIELFTVYSPQELTHDQEQSIKQFLTHATGKKIIAVFKRDHSLIAGLRILSDTLYFEKSVRACLNTLALRPL